MNKYQKEIEKIISKREKDISRKLYSVYQNSLKDIKSELESIMIKYEELNYSEKLNINRLASLKQQIDSQMDFITKTQKKYLYNYLEGIGQLGFNELFYEFEMSRKFPINFTMLNEKIIETIINTPVGNLKLSTRLKDGVVKELRGNILHELARGFNKGDSYHKIAKRLSEAGQSSFRRALTIARTEGGRVSAITRQRSQDYAEKLGIEVEKTWVSTLDGSTRDNHRTLDGQTVKIDGYFKVDGNETLQPHMFGIASEDCNCRCRTISKIKRYDVKLRRDNITGKEIKYKNYNEWLKNKERVRN